MRECGRKMDEEAEEENEVKDQKERSRQEAVTG